MGKLTKAEWAHAFSWEGEKMESKQLAPKNVVTSKCKPRITSKQRAAKFLRDVFPDEASLVKAFREHARDAVARYKRSIGR